MSAESTSRLLNPVLWAKGTFLTPQHLQAQDRFIESLIEFRSASLTYRPWGFTRLRMDPEALAAGAAGIMEAEGLLPDGTPFRIPSADPAPAARALADFLTGDVNKADIFLAIPEQKPQALNVSAPERGITTRYLAEVVMRRDENTGTAERPVQVARKNLRLLVEGENLGGHVLMRAARVQRDSTGIMSYDPAIVPPMLDFRASDTLAGLARRMLEILSAKSSMLSALRRQKNQSLAEFTSTDIANFWLLYAVNHHLPGLRHLYETRGGHPEQLFELLSSLGSTLTTFSSTVQPRDLPVYDHESLGEVFAELEAKVLHLLETVVPSNFVSLPLRMVRPSIYAATIPEEKYLRDTKLYLAFSSSLGEDELIRKTPHLVKLCSATHIEHLVRQALPGVPLLHQPSPPASIPVRLNHQYFMLSQSGLAWEAVERSRTVAVYVPGDFPEPVLELVILLPA